MDSRLARRWSSTRVTVISVMPYGNSSGSDSCYSYKGDNNENFDRYAYGTLFKIVENCYITNNRSRSLFSLCQ